MSIFSSIFEGEREPVPVPPPLPTLELRDVNGVVVTSAPVGAALTIHPAGLPDDHRKLDGQTLTLIVNGAASTTTISVADYAAGTALNTSTLAIGSVISVRRANGTILTVNSQDVTLT